MIPWKCLNVCVCVGVYSWVPPYACSHTHCRVVTWGWTSVQPSHRLCGTLHNQTYTHTILALNICILKILLLGQNRYIVIPFGVSLALGFSWLRIGLWGWLHAAVSMIAAYNRGNEFIGQKSVHVPVIFVSLVKKTKQKTIRMKPQLTTKEFQLHHSKGGGDFPLGLK